MNVKPKLLFEGRVSMVEKTPDYVWENVRRGKRDEQGEKEMREKTC